MSKISPWVAALLSASLAVTACDGGESTPGDASADEAAPVRSVTVPAERQTPFCEAMIELSDDVRAGDLDDVEATIIEVYRSVEADVPPEVADDFALVLDALERGAPPPTDPPRDTIPTTVPPSTDPAATEPTSPSTSSPSTSSTPETTAADQSSDSVDVGFAPEDSPAERINSYVNFACRDAANNPGPPATQPQGPPPDDG